uniref:major capsid protein n=1 Tax=Bacteroides finegoldii TaxID=338188 RepID=UPI0035665F64
MSQSIFDATLDPNNDVKVNNFDWSHANNLTTQIGRVTPIFCELVPAKTSFRVNPRFGLQFMPMVFPIQTRMKARISWYRYPIRALWKDYKDFVGNFREGLEEPYINFNSGLRLQKMASTGSLGDYLGLPTTIFGSFGSEIKSTVSSSVLSVKGNQFGGFSDFTYLSGLPVVSPQNLLAFNSLNPIPTSVSSVSYDVTFESSGSTSVDDTLGIIPVTDVAPFSGTSGVVISSASRLTVTIPWKGSYVPDSKVLSLFNSGSIYAIGSLSSQVEFILNLVSVSFSKNRNIEMTFSFPSNVYNNPLEGAQFSVFYNIFSSIGRRIKGNESGWDFNLTPFGEHFTGVSSGIVKGPQTFKISDLNFSGEGSSAVFSVVSDKPVDIDISTSPWYNSESSNKDKQQKILAYGFRAYEGIYNAYIRDNRNNPYYLNGQVQYNKWIPSDEGGEDNNLYELRYANWEKDFLTTAVQSPQQGNAPLVGITTYAQTVANEDGTTTELIKTALVDEDGKKYGLSFKTSEEGLEGVEYIELDNGTQVRQARSLYDLATSGISIPDLRMVNCYQKFLELNMRKGYSYKDIVEGRFDVKVRYADLLMPEFFGGVSRDIDVNSVTQTVDNNASTGSGDYATALGSQSGIAGVRGEANANIECFCDEESIIMGILIVTPLPVYTQLLPKHFTYRGLMEHYQPEYNLIGFQPIKYNEVCPIQAYNANPDSLTETFGYNRPWYEYAQKYDVAHGLFRTDLSNFLMHRVFDQKPELAQSFLLVDPEQVTDVFAVTETTDKIYGQIWLDITCKLPIARVAIPRLD